MPTYGYECIGCSNSFEIVQRITEDALTTCESCGGVLKKKVFPVGVVFKGSGFYVNDYAKKGADSPKSEPAAETKAVEPTAAAAETKPSESSETPKAAEAKPAEAKPAASATPAA